MSEIDFSKWAARLSAPVLRRIFHLSLFPILLLLLASPLPSGVAQANTVGLIAALNQLDDDTRQTVPHRNARKQLRTSVKNARQRARSGIQFTAQGKDKKARDKFKTLRKALRNYNNNSSFGVQICKSTLGFLCGYLFSEPTGRISLHSE